MASTKTNTQTTQKHVQHHDATDIKKNNYIFVFFGFYFFLFFFYLELLKWILQEMLSYRLGKPFFNNFSKMIHIHIFNYYF